MMARSPRQRAENDPHLLVRDLPLRAPISVPGLAKKSPGSVGRKLSDEAQSSAAKVVECSFCSFAVETRTKGWRAASILQEQLTLYCAL
jgi:hypothetical protein